MHQQESGRRRLKSSRSSNLARRHTLEILERRDLLAVDPVLELKLDVTQSGQSILDSDRQFAVEVGERFDLELRYDDKRPHVFNDNHLGAFTVYADILADNAHAYRPVLSETQIISIAENLQDANGGSLVLRGNGRTVSIPLFSDDPNDLTLSRNAVLALKHAIEAPSGLNYGVDSTTVFEALRAPRNTEGDVGSGDPFEYVIRFVASEYEFADISNLTVDTSGITMTDDAAPPLGELREIPVYTDANQQTLNPAAFLYNLDPRSATLNNRIVYGNVPSGSFHPDAGDGGEVFNELGGTGPLESTGLRAVAAAEFGAQSAEYGAFISPISNVEVFSIKLEAIAASKNVNFTLDRAEGEKNELSAYGIDVALTADQVLIDLVDDPLHPGDDRFGMAFGTIVDHPAVIVTPVDGLQTSETGTTQSFTISLATLPLADVVIDLSSSNENEGTVSHSQITFTPTNGTTPQTITVTGIDDAVDDGDIDYTVVTSPVSSSDPFYNGIDPSDVDLRNIDNDGVGITVSPISGLQTTEAGGSATFTVVLDSQPTSAVTIAIDSSDTTEATTSVEQLVFNPGDWSTPQTVTVTGVDDRIDDDNVGFTIQTGPATSDDSGYNQLDAVDVSGVNQDDDTAGVTLGNITDLEVDEAGTKTATFSVALDTIPVSPVTLNLSVNDSTEGSLSTNTIIFTPENGTNPISVTVSGLDDDQDDGDIPFSIVTAPLSGDPKYSQLNPPDIEVTNIDDDTAGVIVVAPASPITSEAGSTFQISIVLSTVPTHDVVIPIRSSVTAEASVDKASLTFTPANALTPQIVTVHGVDDDQLDGDQPYQIQLGEISSQDVNYHITLDPIAAINTDNELPPPNTDFGDAPENYPTTLLRDGARHTSSGLFLGTAPTLERDGRPTAAADGDEADDGVQFQTNLVAAGSFSTTASLLLDASAVGKLDAWIDFNQDGDWLDPGEQIATSLAVAAGSNFVTINIPSGATAGTTFARFRISESGGLTSTGAATGGEVEDYRVELLDGDAGASVVINTGDGETSIQRNGDIIEVMHAGELLFSADESLLSHLQVEATTGSNTFLVENLEPTELQLILDGAEGDDTAVFVDGGHSIDPGTNKHRFIDIEAINISGSGSDAIVLDAATVANLSTTTDTLTLRTDRNDQPTFEGNWIVSRFEASGEEFFQVMTLDGSTIRLRSDNDWTNPLLPLDVNNSGGVTAIDALQILNQLNRRDLMVGSSGLVAAATLGADFPGKFYDTNRDLLLTPVDALRVINFLAKSNAPNSEQQSLAPSISLAFKIEADQTEPTTIGPLDVATVDYVIGVEETNRQIRIDPASRAASSVAVESDAEVTDPLDLAISQWWL